MFWARVDMPFDQRQAAVVMLDALWRRIAQSFHVTGGGAGSEDPVVTSLKVLAREADLYSILQRDGTGSGRHQPVVVHVLRLIPAPDPGVFGDVVGVGWNVAVEGEEAIHLVGVVGDLGHRTGNFVVLGVVVKDLYPVVLTQPQYLVST